jgi:hypothetical protein
MILFLFVTFLEAASLLREVIAILILLLILHRLVYFIVVNALRVHIFVLAWLLIFRILLHRRLGRMVVDLSADIAWKTVVRCQVACSRSIL